MALKSLYIVASKAFFIQKDLQQRLILGICFNALFKKMSEIPCSLKFSQKLIIHVSSRDEVSDQL